MADNDRQGRHPSDDEVLTGDTPASDRIEGGRRVQPPETESREANPPHTTTGNVTSPKFGSAGSGGAELEPGPERD